ncbi:sigma-70 family RNA polymerase sigma factor [Alkalihalobacillus sp. CinArs1]|uniref:sigma-70 family RNA polymerase sigma factor n=1 Tax=Alkalihalobacillus sp. CinArs1 TaxID=2995314 RepID=UPI0022DD7ABA|nr:sigma-70 family RNA polymerase sigma factor [Alkalihalobacillus sp. CinArs1]
MENAHSIEDATREETIVHLMDEYGDMVKKLAFTYVKDLSTAEDITQDVFISCYHHLNTFEKRSSFKTWLYRITVNRSLDTLKTHAFKKWLPYSKTYHPSNELTPEIKLIQKDDQHAVTESLLQVPHKYRGILYLYYYEELRIREISEITKLNESTIKTRLRRGKQILKLELERRGLQP